ncbi:MAG: restriction endonuclease, partial [Bradymonadaceae bacterium]
AIREDLLAHQGRSPYTTMNERLEKELRKNEECGLDQPRPGVFELDEGKASDLVEELAERNAANLERVDNPRDGNRVDATDRPDEDRTGGQPEESDRSASDSVARKKKKKRTRTRSGGERTEADGDEQRPPPPGERTGEPKASAESTLSDTAHLEEGPVRLKGIPSAAYKVLGELDEDPLPLDDLAEQIFKRKLVKFHTHDEVATVRSALVNDNQVREGYGHRPLFKQTDQGWGLTEWDLPDEVHDREQLMLSLSEEIRRAAVDELGEALRGAPSESLEHIALTLLERLGYRSIKVSKRSSDGDAYFTTDWKKGLGDVRVCVRVSTDADGTLGADAISDLRETLDHYSASEGLIIHLGNFDPEAVKESRKSNHAPITLFDRRTFVELLVKHGIGIEEYEAPIPTVDRSFIDALQ